jgi:hypothetical protein
MAGVPSIRTTNSAALRNGKVDARSRDLDTTAPIEGERVDRVAHRTNDGMGIVQNIGTEDEPGGL